MRDNVKSGALTEVTFYILLSLYSPKHGFSSSMTLSYSRLTQDFHR